MARGALGGMKFRGRLTLFVSAIVVASLTLVGLTVALRFQSALTDEINGTLTIEAQNIKTLTENAFAEREAGVQSWSEDSILRGGLMFQTFDKSDAVLKVLKARYAVFRALVMFTPDGAAVSAGDPAIRDRFAAQKEQVQRTAWFTDALAAKDHATQLDLDDPILGGPVLYLARPVTSPSDGKVLGVLVAAYDWNQLSEEVSSAISRAHARGQQSFQIMVVDANGKTLFSSAADKPATIDVHQFWKEGTVSGTGQLGDRVVAYAMNDVSTRDAGDGWLFLATLDRTEAYAEVVRSLWITGAMVALFSALAFVFSWLLARAMVRPITELNHAVSRIVSEGDLSQTLTVESGDEIGELASSFNAMVAKLRMVPTTLKETVSQLSRAVETIGTMTSQQNVTLSRQAAALQETATTAREIQEISNLAATKAGAVTEVAARAQAIGQSGQRAMDDTLKNLDLIQTNVQQVVERIGELSERTGQVAEITDTVKDLADQSKVLALNAAIEATKAGEHGKGFGVVAREIRALAAQSIGSTVRVREILGEVETSIRQGVDSSRDGREQVRGSVDQVRAGSENIRQLALVVEENASAAKQIAAAVGQQNAGITQIFSAMSDLNDMMSESVAALKRSTEAAKDLQTVTASISEIVNAFRV